jgi:hypothetical protein
VAIDRLPARGRKARSGDTVRRQAARMSVRVLQAGGTRTSRASPSAAQVPGMDPKSWGNTRACGSRRLRRKRARLVSYLYLLQKPAVVSTVTFTRRLPASRGGIAFISSDIAMHLVCAAALCQSIGGLSAVLHDVARRHRVRAQLLITFRPWFLPAARATAGLARAENPRPWHPANAVPYHRRAISTRGGK